MDLGLLLTETLQCPQCHGTSTEVGLFAGEAGLWFAQVQCSVCGEDAFLQIDPPSTSLNGEEGYDPWAQRAIQNLQTEWEEWFTWRERYLTGRQHRVPRFKRKSEIGFAFVLVSLVVFFLWDQYHLLGILLGDRDIRQRIVKEYAQKIYELPCLSASMRAVIQSVPILYTEEGVYRRQHVQFGETGSYDGTILIKIYRSNFWFFGWPKKTILIETLVHELRHRASPALGHAPIFYQLVQQDTQCVLAHW